MYEDVLVSAGARTSTMGEMKHSSSGMMDLKLDRISSDFHQVRSLGTSFFDLKFNIRLVFLDRLVASPLATVARYGLLFLVVVMGHPLGWGITSGISTY